MTGKALSRNYISDVLRQASETRVDNSGKRFVSREALVRDLDECRVSSLLQQCFSEEGNDAGDLNNDAGAAAAYITSCPAEGAQCKKPRCTGARIIFVMLSLIAREDCIVDFIRDGICDHDLPFSVKPTRPASREGAAASSSSDPPPAAVQEWSAMETRLASCEGATSDPPHEAQEWSTEVKRLFCHFQWTMLSRYIENTPLADIKTETFDAEACLPWSEYGHAREQHNMSPSFIRKVKISRHYNNFGYKYLALKGQQSRVNGWDSFDNEVDGHVRTVVPHENIVTLLAAFKHAERSYLMFPWAELGSLKNLWKDLMPQGSRLGPELPSWCAPDWIWNQCRGLADGLSFLHGFQGSRTVVPQLHADIQPRNILCFETQGHDGKLSYTLKISDFEFSAKFSEAGKTEKIPVGHTVPTYHPPGTREYEDKEYQCVSQNWDVWCLGCVYLEFLSWFLYGHEEGVERFANERLAEEHDKEALDALNSRRKEQTFFRVILRSPPLVKDLDALDSRREEQTFIWDILRSPRLVKDLFRFRRKRVECEVREPSPPEVGYEVRQRVIDHYRRLQRDFTEVRMRRLVGFIEQSMLVVDNEQRATSEVVYEFFNTTPSETEES